MFGDCVINALQTNFLTDQRAIVQANSSSEKQGISAWSIVKVVGGALVVAVGVSTIIASAGTLSGAGITGIITGIKAIAGAAPAIKAIAGGVMVAARRNCCCRMGS